MKVAIYANRSSHQIEAAEAFAAGLAAHGIEAEKHSAQNSRNAKIFECDLAVFWSARYTAIADAQREAGKDFLIMERGFIGDRNEWTALSFNGLNGRGEYPNADKGDSERFNKHFGRLLQPWKGAGSRALIMGQCPGDMSIAGKDLAAWYPQAVTAMRQRGFDVRFRPHPLAASVRVPGVDTMTGDLRTALSWTDVVATYNSNSGVDAVLAGVPTIACDAGSMAWPVAAQGLAEEWERPDRGAWASRLAWCQWTQAEIASGEAWAFLTGKG